MEHVEIFPPFIVNLGELNEAEYVMLAEEAIALYFLFCGFVNCISTNNYIDNHYLTIYQNIITNSGIVPLLNKFCKSLSRTNSKFCERTHCNRHSSTQYPYGNFSHFLCCHHLFYFTNLHQFHI